MLKDPSEPRGYIIHGATVAMQRMSKMNLFTLSAWLGLNTKTVVFLKFDL